MNAVRWRLGLACFTGAALLGLGASARAAGAAPTEWTTTGATTTNTGNSCSTCHSNPTSVTSMKAAIWTGYSTLANFKATLAAAGTPGSGAPASPHNYFGGNAAVSDLSRQNVLTYLLQVRNGAISTETPAFASTVVGQFSDVVGFTFTISNYRDNAINWSVGAPGGDFTVQSKAATGTGCTATQIPAATAAAGPMVCTITLTLRFQPSTTGARTANLPVTLTPIDGTDPALLGRNITLSGVGTAPAFSITAPAAFSANVGSSTTQALTITNTGTATLTLGSLLAPIAGGTAPGDFQLVAAAATACNINGSSTAVPAGASCNLLVRFTPGAKGARTGTLTIPHNASGGQTAVGLSGTGSQATLSLVPASVAMGNVNLGGSASNPTAFVLSNTGDAAFALGTLNVGGTGANEFAVSGCAAALGAGASCNLAVTYTPVAAATRSVTLTVSGNASNTPAATITGAAFSLPTVSAVAAFPDTPVNTSTSGAGNRTVTISNPRASALGYGTSFAGANPGDFAIAAGGESCPGHSVAAGGSCTISLQFAPAAAGGASARSATLNLSFTPAAGEPTPPTQGVALAGNATLVASFNIDTNPVAFAAVVGTPSTATAKITNTGSAPLKLGALSFGGAFPADFSTAAANACTTNLTLAANGGSCVLTIQFAPAATGLRGATLSIAHDAPGSPQGVTLNGSATAAPQPAIDLGSGATLSFGAVALGSSAQQTTTVTNNGAAPLNFAAFTITAPTPGEFARGGTCTTAAALAAGATCTVVVTFTPSATGTRSGSIGITSNASNGAVAIALSGDGQGLAEPVLSPATIDPFPSTLLGSASAVTRQLTISNARANSIGYAAVFSGGDVADFAVVGETCPTKVVPAGGACTLTLQFTANAGAAGGRATSLSLTFVGSGADPAPAPRLVPLSGMAAAPTPVFGISASSLSITAVVGSSACGKAVITNSGSATLTLSSLVFGGVSAAEFGLAAAPLGTCSANTCGSGAALAPNQSCDLVVRYTPAAVGGGSAMLSITHNAAGSPQALTLTGTATAAPRPGIALGPQALNFADTPLGATSAPQTVTVQNSGSAPLNFSAFTLGGAAAAEFVRRGSCSTATPLAVAAQCTLILTFQPNAPVGARSAALTVLSDAVEGAATVSLTGTATAASVPQLTLAPATLAFGSQTVGGLYPKRSVTLTNTGSVDLSALALLVQGAAFSNGSVVPCAATLAIGASCAVDIAFAPLAAGTDYTGTLQVSSSAGAAPQTVALSGRGSSAAVPVLVWSPAVTRLDFGQVTAGSVSATQSLTLLNQGPGGASLTLLNAVGLDGAAYSVTSTACAAGQTLFEGASCAINVRFAPASAGTKSAALQVASSGSLPPSVALAGTGLGGPGADLTLSTNALAFALTRVGAASLPAEITLASSGSGVVRVLAMTISGAYTMQAKTCPAAPFTLVAGSSCSVTVSFVPQAAGSVAGKLNVSSDGVNALREVTLNGQGEEPAQLSGGGCSIADGDSAADPTLWALLLLALGALGYRWRARRAEVR